MIPVYENFRDYEPPPWVTSTVERLLSSLAPEHTAGLQSIVLTNSHTVRGKTGRVGRRKYNQNECHGFYHRASRKEKAWIELLVDNFVESYPSGPLRIQFFRDMVVAGALFHEIGHHLDATLAQRREVENLPLKIGESGCLKFTVERGGRKRYWYLRPFAPALN